MAVLPVVVGEGDGVLLLLLLEAYHHDDGSVWWTQPVRPRIVPLLRNAKLPTDCESGIRPETSPIHRTFRDVWGGLWAIQYGLWCRHIQCVFYVPCLLV